LFCSGPLLRYINKAFGAVGGKATAVASMVSTATKALAARAAGGERSQSPVSTQTANVFEEDGIPSPNLCWPGRGSLNGEETSPPSNKWQQDSSLEEAMRIYLGLGNLPHKIGASVSENLQSGVRPAIRESLHKYRFSMPRPPSHVAHRSDMSQIETEYLTQVERMQFKDNERAFGALNTLRCDRAIVHVHPHDDATGGKFVALVRPPNLFGTGAWYRGDTADTGTAERLLDTINPDKEAIDVYAAWSFRPLRTLQRLSDHVPGPDSLSMLAVDIVVNPHLARGEAVDEDDHDVNTSQEATPSPTSSQRREPTSRPPSSTLIPSKTSSSTSTSHNPDE